MSKAHARWPKLPLATPDGKMLLNAAIVQTPWTPDKLSLAAWFDANSGVTTTGANEVTQWASRVGSVTATQSNANSRPKVAANSLNSLPTLSFDGNDHLLMSVASGAYQGVWIVYKDTSTATYSTFLGSVYTSYGQFHGAQTSAGLFSSTYTQPSTRNGANQRNGTSIGDGTTTARPSAFCIQSHVPTAAGLNTLTTIGADDFQPTTRAIIGNIAEIIICAGAPSASDRLRLDGYLAHKWGLAGLLPAGHAYKSAPPTL